MIKDGQSSRTEDQDLAGKEGGGPWATVQRASLPRGPQDCAVHSLNNGGSRSEAPRDLQLW